MDYCNDIFRTFNLPNRAQVWFFCIKNRLFKESLLESELAVFTRVKSQIKTIQSIKSLAEFVSVKLGNNAIQNKKKSYVKHKTMFDRSSLRIYTLVFCHVSQLSYNLKQPLYTIVTDAALSHDSIDAKNPIFTKM